MIPWKILRSRRRTLAIEITPKGEVLLRAPARMSRKDILAFAESRRDWIEAHLAQITPAEPLTPEEHRALIRAARQQLPGRVQFFADRMGVSFGRISVRSQRTRWGSCSAEGNLSFNCLLMAMPEEVRDYVIVHELCHRRQMDHSPRFWAEVAAVLPGYAAQRQWLKDHGASLLSRLPDAQK